MYVLRCYWGIEQGGYQRLMVRVPEQGLEGGLRVVSSRAGSVCPSGVSGSMVGKKFEVEDADL